MVAMLFVCSLGVAYHGCNAVCVFIGCGIINKCFVNRKFFCSIFGPNINYCVLF